MYLLNIKFKIEYKNYLFFKKIDNKKEFRLKMFYFEFKRLSSGYIFQEKNSLQSSGGMVVEKNFQQPVLFLYI